jgi:hypothetical protein
MRVDKLLYKFSKNYLITSLVIAIGIFSLFMFFTTKVKSFPTDFHTFLESSSLSVLIGYQYGIVNYLHSNIGPTFSELKPLFKDDQFRLDRLLKKSANYYLTIVLIIASFILLEFFRVPHYFYLFEPFNRWALVLDIVNHIFSYLMLFLLAIIVWIFINLMVFVHSLEKCTSVNIDRFHGDGIGGLGPLRNFILIIVSNYFIIITLAIISYISPTAIISYETIFLISMLFLGVMLFLITQRTIKNLINSGLKLEIVRINGEYKKNYDKLISVISDKEHTSNKGELEKLSLILDILEKEKTKIERISPKNYDLRTIVTFIGSFLIPTVTLIEKIRGFIS